MRAIGLAADYSAGQPDEAQKFCIRDTRRHSPKFRCRIISDRSIMEYVNEKTAGLDDIRSCLPAGTIRIMKVSEVF
ncbi:MAG: hypothetical protein ACLURV_09460 [Gallintestinimicrobium sp.]